MELGCWFDVDFFHLGSGLEDRIEMGRGQINNSELMVVLLSLISYQNMGCKEHPPTNMTVHFFD